MNAHSTQRLIELVDSKHKCLSQLCELNQRQLALIQAGTMAELLDLLATKQKVLNELERVERGLDPFRGQDPAARRWPTPELKDKCAQQLQQCEAMLATVVAQEQRSQQELARRRDEAAARLRGAHHAHTARKAYAASRRPRASRIDVVSED